MVVAWVAITDCITSLPSASSTATEMVLWWTSRPIYLMLSIGCSFREVGYCSAQQPNPTAKGAPFYNACPTQAVSSPSGGLLRLERLDRLGLVFLDVEHGVKLGDLQEIVDILAEVHQLELTALIAD